MDTQANPSANGDDYILQLEGVSKFFGTVISLKTSPCACAAAKCTACSATTAPASPP
jgi:hypothetical protein